jgi:4-hydroxy-tetrahydrodipicolinate reductase
MAIGKAASDALDRPIPTTSVRTGSVPGTHELIFDGAFEQLSLTHVARDRRVFAEGALKAADWLIGKKGVFTMRDVLERASPR